jgi:hypothetical protein
LVNPNLDSPSILESSDSKSLTSVNDGSTALAVADEAADQRMLRIHCGRIGFNDKNP